MRKIPELVFVPEGGFIMGSSRQEVNEQIKNNSGVDKRLFERQLPKHKVCLADYRIGRYPVTNRQFSGFVKEAGYKTAAEREGWGLHFDEEMKKVEGASWQHSHGPDSNTGGKEKHPVVVVSWFDCQEFCQWLSKTTKKVWRLPTEAEWEKAARGANGNLWPWGNEWDEKKCNYANRTGDTTPVGKYSPQGDSPYGCSDLAGNILEWTSTTIGVKDPWPSRFEYPYRPKNGREDLSLDARRVGRGGNFQRNKDFCRCAFRFADMPSDRYSSMGFRVVCEG